MPAAPRPTPRTCAQPPLPRRVSGLEGSSSPSPLCLFPQPRSPTSAPEELEVTGQSRAMTTSPQGLGCSLGPHVRPMSEAPCQCPEIVVGWPSEGCRPWPPLPARLCTISRSPKLPLPWFPEEAMTSSLQAELTYIPPPPLRAALQTPASPRGGSARLTILTEQWCQARVQMALLPAAPGHRLPLPAGLAHTRPHLLVPPPS